jgi:CRP-like cAMP-binding protein
MTTADPRASDNVTGNLLLDSLPAEDLGKVRSKARLVGLAQKQVLSTQGEPVRNIYFPTKGLVSCRASGSEGETVEIYPVGHEGIVEPAAILTGIAAVTAEVQIAGEAYSIDVDDLCAVIRETTELPKLLLKYAYSLAVRMVQATKCAMFHTVQQRLVLWLLFAYRAQGLVIPCTHQAIADALGTRRASVTLVLNSLEEKGIIELHRGRIRITSRSGLENASCECFQLIKAAMHPDLECQLISS